MVTVNDAYEILNLPLGAPQEKVLANYRTLALKWHPDKNKQSSESFEKFRKLCCAFHRIIIHDKEFTNDLTMEQMFEIFQDAFLLHKKNGCNSYNSSSEDGSDDEIARDDEEEDSDIEIKQVEKTQPIHKAVTQEVAKKNAEELLAEEEKERKKVEKRRAKKKRRRQKKKMEKELNQEKTKDAKPQSETQNKDKTKLISSEESESEEEWDPKSAFVTTVANKRATNYIQNSKPEKVTCDDTKDLGTPNEDNDPTILNSRKLAIRANEIASVGMFEAAIDLFSRAIKMNPKDFRFYGNRSYCYEKIKLYDRALKDADKAISLNPRWPKNYYRKGRALAGLMQFTEAEKSFEKVLSLDKDCKDAEQELLSIRIDKMMEMGFTRAQACFGIKQYGSIEKAVEAMSHFKGTSQVVNAAANEGDVFISDEESPNSLNKHKNYTPVTDMKMDPNNPEGITALWVGNISKDVTEKLLRSLFGQ